MASSQVEIVSSMPFGRVLKHHNHHDSFITHAAFNESIKAFVKEHLNTSFDSSPNHYNNKKSINNNNADNTWVSRVSKNNLGTLSFIRRNHNNNNIIEESSLPALVSPRHSSVIDRWAARQAQETLENHHHNHHHHHHHHRDNKKVLEDLPSEPPSSCVEEISNLGASSLVQIWEKRLNHSSNCTTISSPGRSSNENTSACVKRCIRGRHAFNDLLMQLERERYRELNNLAQRCAVSKFTHRGRIQSLIGLRLLQHEVAVFDQSCLKSATAKVNSQLPQEGSEIMQPRREGFTTEVEDKSSALVEVSHADIANNKITQSDNSDIIIIQINKDSQCNTIFGTENSTVQAIATNNEESESESHPTSSNETFQRDDDVPKQIIGAFSSIINSNENEVDASLGQEYITTEESNDYEIAEEEEEIYDQNYYDESGYYYDWMSPISRPRSYWEELRQSWYREILDFGSDNEEIRNLLQRRTVSTFLSSDFRERMDRLMESRIGSSQTNLISSNQDDDEYRHESRNESMAYFLEQMNFEGSNNNNNKIPPEDGMDKSEREEEEEKAEEEGEEKAEESIIITNDSESDHETGDCCCPSSAPSMNTYSPSTDDLLRTWSYQDNEVINIRDDYDHRVGFGSSQEPPPRSSESFYQHSRLYSSSSSNQNSIEMECIYELRGQMDQMFHEMSELRKSIKICMDMQMQLQQLRNQEVYTVKEETEKKLREETPKKSKCRICNEKNVSAVLYRCGHMCMCFKCAKELQWKGENCLICKTPIIDVVRVYGDN